MIKYKYQTEQYKSLFSKNNLAIVEQEFLKDNPKGTDKSLIRIYKKYEKINRIIKEVFYIVVYKGTSAVLEDVILFKRTMSLKEINRIKKHIKGLK